MLSLKANRKEKGDHFVLFYKTLEKDKQTRILKILKVQLTSHDSTTPESFRESTQ